MLSFLFAKMIYKISKSAILEREGEGAAKISRHLHSLIHASLNVAMLTQNPLQTEFLFAPNFFYILDPPYNIKILIPWNMD